MKTLASVFRDHFETLVEEYDRKMAAHSPVGFYHTMLEGRIVEANEAFLRIVGYPSLEAVNQVGVPNLYENPADRQRLIEMLQRGPATGFETRLRRADGRVIDVLLNVWLAQESDGTSYLEGMAEDVTGRNRAEEALHESEERPRLDQRDARPRDFQRRRGPLPVSQRLL